MGLQNQNIRGTSRRLDQAPWWPQTPAVTPAGASPGGWHTSSSLGSQLLFLFSPVHLNLDLKQLLLKPPEPRLTPGWCLLSPYSLSRTWALDHPPLLLPTARLSTCPASNPGESTRWGMRGDSTEWLCLEEICPQSHLIILVTCPLTACSRSVPAAPQ